MSADAARRLAALADDLTAFRHYLQSERGMAVNTVAAYGRDLDHFSIWVADGTLKDYLHPTLRELSQYLSFLREQGLAPPSVGRNLVALKMFYRFLRLDERTTDSAVELLSSPALWERIPQVLSPENVDRLLAAPRADDRFYLRDKALLETLYATGARASEVAGLQMNDLYLDGGFCKCQGKGSKQRVVPLGMPAVTALKAYLHESRPRLLRGNAEVSHVFVSRGGRALTREMVWILVKKYVKRAGLHAKAVKAQGGVAKKLGGAVMQVSAQLAQHLIMQRLGIGLAERLGGACTVARNLGVAVSSPEQQRARS